LIWILYIKPGVQVGSYGKITLKARCLATLDGTKWRKPMGEKAKEFLTEN